MRFIYTKTFAIFTACVLVLALLVFMEVKGWLEPVRNLILRSPRPVVKIIKGIVTPAQDFFSTIYQLKKINSENFELKSRVGELEQDLAQLNQQSHENEALRKELGFVRNTKMSLLACNVLSKDAFGLNDSLIISCGQNDGLSQGQAIISQGYLVGKIIYAGKTQSTVLLAVSSKFLVDARVSQTMETAVVKGSFGSGLILDQVPQTGDLQKGWLVVTAGVNDKMPKNILIGEVRDILSGSSDLFKRAALTTPIDFDNLEFVFVVR